jgi:aldehyde:ferredoxin oxidoreductase
MFGWMGKVLWVDLSTGKLKVDKLNQQWLKNFIGGRGLGIYYLRP